MSRALRPIGDVVSSRSTRGRTMDARPFHDRCVHQRDPLGGQSEGLPGSRPLNSSGRFTLLQISV